MKTKEKEKFSILANTIIDNQSINYFYIDKSFPKLSTYQKAVYLCSHN